MERRRYVRHEVPLPVHLGGCEGTTLDMSIGGAYFEAPLLDLAVGKPIEFLVTFGKGPSDLLRVRCAGVVIRIEERPGTPRIAVSIDSFAIGSTDFGPGETEH